MKQQTWARAGKLYGLLHERLHFGFLDMTFHDGVIVYRWVVQIGDKRASVQHATSQLDLDYRFSLLLLADAITKRWQLELQRLASQPQDNGRTG